MFKTLLTLALVSGTAAHAIGTVKVAPPVASTGYVYQTQPIGVFVAPQSAIATPRPEDRDRLFVEAIIPVGNKNVKGKPANVSERRPPVILRAKNFTTSDSRDDHPFTDYDSNLLTDVKLNADEVLLANFHHLGKFYVAIIPLQSVQSIDAGYVIFASLATVPYAAHFLTFFNLDKQNPVRLIAEVPTLEERIQGKGFKMLEQEITLDNVVLSIEGTNAIGNGDYDLVRGQFGWMTNTFSITDIQTQYLDYLKSGYPKERYRTLFNPLQAQVVLSEALHSADRAGLELEYNTLWSNCTSRGMEIYKRAARRGFGIMDIVAPIGNVYPIVNKLEHGRGFFDDSITVPNMEVAPEYQADFAAIRAAHPELPKR